jgi:hypothetical protein
MNRQLVPGFFALALTVTSATLAADTVEPADAAPGLLWGYPALVLLNEPRVQDELGFSDTQRRKAAAASFEYLSAAKERVQSQRSVAREPKDGPERTLQQINQQFNKLLHDHGSNLLSELDPPQRQRLKEIVIQLRGFEILFYDDVAQTLRLDVAQRRALAEVRAEAAVSLKAAHEQFERNPRAKADRTAGILQNSTARALECLTESQRHSMRELRGRDIPFARGELRLVLSQNAAAAARTGNSDEP